MSVTTKPEGLSDVGRPPHMCEHVAHAQKGRFVALRACARHGIGQDEAPEIEITRMLHR
jgi:hypothetical protein